jgi:hypothetical protein
MAGLERGAKAMKRYVIGRMVDGKKHEFEGLDWFECEIWNRWGAEIVPEATAERVVW